MRIKTFNIYIGNESLLMAIPTYIHLECDVGGRDMINRSTDCLEFLVAGINS